MFAEIGAELARLEKDRRQAELKKIQEERNRRQMDEAHLHQNIQLLETAFKAILVSFNAEAEKSLRLSVRNTPEALMVSRASGTIIWLRISANKLYYRAPARGTPVITYRFMIERDAKQQVIFYPDNLPTDRMDTNQFVAVILKHALGLLV